MILWNWLEGLSAFDVALLLLVCIWSFVALVRPLLKEKRLRRK